MGEPPRAGQARNHAKHLYVGGQAAASRVRPWASSHVAHAAIKGSIQY